MLIAFFTACNNSGYDSTKTDSAAAKDNTNMYDTGVGSSMTDTAQRRDSVIPNRMQDTSIKKQAMKITVIAVGVLLIVSCSSGGGNAKTTDSVTINTTETNKADGGPNNGLGDTNTINRSNDTVTHDTLNKNQFGQKSQGRQCVPAKKDKHSSYRKEGV